MSDNEGSGQLQQAEALLSEGKEKKALEELWTAYSRALGDRRALEEILEFIPRLQSTSTDKKVVREASAIEADVSHSIKLATESDSRPSPFAPRFRTGIPVSTASDIPGWTVTEYIGEVFGIVVRSRGLLPQMGANLKSNFGGEIGTQTNLVRETRMKAVERLVEEAVERGADAVIAMRFDIAVMGGGASAGWSEVCAYGTAVRAQRLPNDST